ncbi:uncharacterized protein BP01DRAFT_424313 [Aspergillus saccharolyticus JOP 1030-1]|uniref:Uncharacterized protein n=1 Tax=Aspergillus saccharolyticus JOP 1030-1 TaxID=1450539 RepID=A0A318ZKF3_9EURO|nr:hypothetical protein BP01DRAFT_424313 [Aspergillus saccharolyticus JOP 1030-1]PYH44260.1 hypothetical protein BP01DRAFT_424313 [Aspergillus saccharolyticus JOP 1030-1]
MMFNPNIHGPRPGHDQDDPIVLDGDEDLGNHLEPHFDSDTDDSSESVSSRPNDRNRLPAHVLAQQQLSQLQWPQHDRPSNQSTTITTTTNDNNNTPNPPRTTSTTTDTNPTTETQTLYHASLEQDKKHRSRVREERHAALCVLMDRELLTVQALAAHETIPQTRRRFLAKLLSPEDPESATTLQADRFIIQHPTLRSSRSRSHSPPSRSGSVSVGASLPGSPAAASATTTTITPGGISTPGPSGATTPGATTPGVDERRSRIGVGIGIGGPITTTGLIVPRRVEDVCETDEGGWRRPVVDQRERDRGGAGTNRGSPAGSTLSSSSAGRAKGGGRSSAAATAGSTPERNGRRVKGRSQRERERERGRTRRGLVGAGSIL